MKKLIKVIILLFISVISGQITAADAQKTPGADTSGLYSSKMINISFSNKLKDEDDFFIFGVPSSLILDSSFKVLNQNDALSDLLKLGIFKGKFGEIFQSTIIINKKLKPVILVGIGEKVALSNLKYIELGGKLAVYIKKNKINSASVFIPALSAEKSNAIAEGLLSRSYEFTKYKTNYEAANANISIITKEAQEAYIYYKKLFSLYESIYITRDLATEPANVLTPDSFSVLCKKLEDIGVEVEIHDASFMKKLGMNALLAVAQGSSNPPKLVILKWLGMKNKEDAPIALLGKGVTYDSGGLSLKSTKQMDGVKCDMTGAAVVVSVIKYLAEQNIPVNVVGVLGLVENMPDGNAQRPGDVVTSMSGKTIEVINTDAEGRLLLADTLWYCQNRFKPKLMIDLATLTGAMIVSLGTEYAGFFSNNDKLAQKLIQSGSNTGEKIWRLPLDPGYARQLKSEIADLQNMGNEKNAGSIVAAEFLQKFVNNVPWVHIDIAGAGWYEVNTDITPKGASGFGIKLLVDLIQNIDKE